MSKSNAQKMRTAKTMPVTNKRYMRRSMVWVTAMSPPDDSDFLARRLAILPIWDAEPTATTTPRPSPWVTLVWRKARLTRSPTARSSGREPIERLDEGDGGADKVGSLHSVVIWWVTFCTGTDSPVRAASSISKWVASSRRMSAGTLMPWRSSTMSPMTISSTGTSVGLPLRTTRALLALPRWRMAARAASDLTSWYAPIDELTAMTSTTTTASIHSSLTTAMTNTAIRMSVRTLNTCPATISHTDRVSASASALSPYCSRRASTSRSVRPTRVSLTSTRASASSVVRACQSLAVSMASVSRRLMAAAMFGWGVKGCRWTRRHQATSPAPT
eukprot:m.478513 g.478513  ORF g.478513 m.478513 type:complete len:331 (-) comp21155_c0_seq1:2574-3566(-)